MSGWRPQRIIWKKSVYLLRDKGRYVKGTVKEENIRIRSKIPELQQPYVENENEVIEKYLFTSKNIEKVKDNLYKFWKTRTKKLKEQDSEWTLRGSRCKGKYPRISITSHRTCFGSGWFYHSFNNKTHEHPHRYGSRRKEIELHNFLQIKSGRLCQGSWQ